MRAVRLLFRAQAVINHFLMRAASTLEITNGGQRVLRKFSASWNLSLLKLCFEPINLSDTFETGLQVQSYRKLGNMIRPYRGSTIPSSLQAYSQLCTRVSGWTLNGI